MCTTAGALSVASMRTRLIPFAAPLACAASPAPAHAAGARLGRAAPGPPPHPRPPPTAGEAPPPAGGPVSGGGPGGHEPIAVTADRAVKKLATAVVSWSADCDDGMRFPFEGELAPAKAQPGFSPGPGDLVMSRNARGRFSGT